MLLYIKILMLAIFLYLSNTAFLERIYTIGYQPGLVVFLSIWLVALAGLAVIAFHSNTRGKIFWAITIPVLTAISKAHFDITSTYLSISEFELLINLVGFADNATAFYGNMLLPAFLVLILGVTGLLLPPYYQNRFINRKQLLLVPVLPVVLTSLIIYFRGGEGSNGLPDYSNIVSYATVLSLDSVLHEKEPIRKKVSIEAKNKRHYQNIVFIMDESIRGDFLAINNNGGVKTHLPPDITTNFGIASSASNCSTATNVSVRYGANKKTYMHDIKSNPSIWEYAKKAGYNTSYIDGQRTDGQLMNMMTDEEMSNIDHFIQLPGDTQPDKKDIEIAIKLRRMLSEGKPHFIYINKMGAHFPYEGKYPGNIKIASPTMPRTYFGNESDPHIDKSHINFSGQKGRIINSYKNAINWNVSHFFDVLLDNLDLTNTVIVYTSDHGQNFSTTGKHGFRTHCTMENASKMEGIVPFFVLTANRTLHEKLVQATNINTNRVSHFNIYPTLLLLLGYSEEDIRKAGHNEKTIFEALPENNREFISYFFTRLGKKPIWVNID